MTDTRRYTIDMPPSLNGIFTNRRGGRAKTTAYKRWKDVASWQVKLQHDGDPLEGPASVTMSMPRPRSNADIDNRIKPVLDALEAGGALGNDKQVTSVCAAWANHKDCIVTVSPDVGAAT